MKKIVLLVALVAVLVMALSGVAYADKGTALRKSGAVGYSYVGAGDGTPADTLQIYAAWTSGVASFTANAGSSSPHGNYATTTVKCAVCHAVHWASDKGDTLLKMPANQACIACHVTAQLGGTNMVYGGSAAIANGDGNDHHTIGTNCDECHSSIHGAGAIPAVGADAVPTLAGVILTNSMNPRTVANAQITTGTAVNGSSVAAVDTLLGTSNTAATREVAIGLFCQGCHNGSYQNGQAGTIGGLNGTVLMTGHRVGADVVANASYNTGANTVINANLNTTSTASYNGQVAWAAASDCKSCHDGAQFANGTGGQGFPHFTQGAARFLNMSSSFAVADVPSQVSVSADASYAGTVTASADASWNYPAVVEFSLRDGVCLKCHKGTATTGVGQSY